MTRDELLIKELPDGREVYVFPLLGGRARVAVGPPLAPYVDDVW